MNETVEAQSSEQILQSNNNEKLHMPEKNRFRYW